MTTAIEMKLEVGIHVPKCQMTRVQMTGEEYKVDGKCNSEQEAPS